MLIDFKPNKPEHYITKDHAEFQMVLGRGGMFRHELTWMPAFDDMAVKSGWGFRQFGLDYIMFFEAQSSESTRRP
jgi:hypothetical protein